MKLKHICLTVSLVAFTTGFSPGDSIYWGFGLPVGVILFGLFMIFSVLEKEVALLDDEKRIDPARPDFVESNSFSSQDKPVERGYGSVAIGQSGST